MARRWFHLRLWPAAAAAACVPLRPATGSTTLDTIRARKGPVLLECTPPSGWSGCVGVAVYVAAPPEKVFAFVTDIERLGRFFPRMEFRLRSGGPLRPGSEYEVRGAGGFDASQYRIVAYDPGRRLAAEQVTGAFRRFRYDHRFLPAGGGTVSQEIVEYDLPGGAWARLVDVLYVRGRIRRDLLRAHRRLKDLAEADGPDAPASAVSS